MSEALGAVVFPAAVLLAAAGVVKLVRPDASLPALGAAGLPARRGPVQVLGIGELGAGIAVLYAPSPVTCGLLALAYLCFAGFIARLLAVGATDMSCGCAGKAELPPSLLHLALNLVAAAGALIAMWSPPSGVAAWVGSLGAYGAIAGLGVVGAAWAAYLTAAFTPVLFASYRRTGG